LIKKAESELKEVKKEAEEENDKPDQNNELTLT